MKIYTRTGDQGSTSLFGRGRVMKCDLRLEVCGTIDELNAVLGVARAGGLPSRIDEAIGRLQNQLFDLGAELASPDPAGQGTEILQERDIQEQESLIDDLEQRLSPLTTFILPGGTSAAASLHLARSVCRRAERLIVALSQENKLRPAMLKFVNRTSDLLFVLARAANAAEGRDDIPWTKSEPKAP